jgi:hypothetical protein
LYSCDISNIVVGNDPLPDHGMLANCAKVGTELLLFPKLDCPQRMGVQMENLKIE